MGVSRFFRWMSERWPCIFNTMNMETAPPTDNFFFNLNSVLQDAALHSGGHGDTSAILKHIETSIEKIVTTIKPKKLIFISLDGVSPNAKLNQHRSRKFKIGENMKLAAAAAARRGESLKSFDLNALTPGTAFMVELMSCLKSLIRTKIKDDPSWAPKVIMSGCDVPGEADHKILDYLRQMKNSGDWKPNQRHCFYGLDAQTIILSLVIHEPHCYLFKESSSRPKGSKGPAAREMLEHHHQEDFISCSVGLLRDYIELELKYSVPRNFQFDLERALDDFVLLCIIAGNDFLPCVESFDGMDLLLENLLDSYKSILPSLGGYITHVGRINGDRLQKLLEHCSDKEELTVIHQLKAIKDGECMVDGVPIHRDFLFTSNRAASDIFNASITPEEAIQWWKNRHYHEKLQIDVDEKQNVMSSYFEGLNWAMRCYYRGLPSWSWSYPYHYAPMMSDLKNMDPAKVLFKMGTSLPPLLYLMAVLPRASSKLVPKVMQALMVDPKSLLAHYYPNDCRVDMEGRRLEREAVVLLPFCDEQKFRSIMSKMSRSDFTKEEIERMRVGHSLIFTSADGLIRVHFYESHPGQNNGITLGDKKSLKSLSETHDFTLSSLKVFRSELPIGSLTGTKSPHGYWSLKSWNVLPSLKKIGVCLFSYPSDRLSLQLTAPSAMKLPCLESLIGRLVYVDWPNLRKGRVVQVENHQIITTSKTASSSFSERPLACQQMSITRQKCKEEEWFSKGKAIGENNLAKKGIETGQVEVLVTVKPINGCLRSGLDQVQEKYGPVEIHPLQAILLDNPYPHHKLEIEEEHRLDLTTHDRLLYLGEDHPGSVATILDSCQKSEYCMCHEELRTSEDSVLVSLQPQSPEVTMFLKATQKLLRTTVDQYYPSGAVATRLGVTPQGLSRITGSLWVSTGLERQEIGLAVKLGSKNMCVVGYVRPSPNGTGWEYTELLISILENYRQSFYWVFEAVDATPEGGEINLKQVFPQMTEQKLNDMVKRTKLWLQSLPLNGRPLISAEAKVGSIMAIDEAQKLQKQHFTTSTKALTTYLSKSLLIPPVDKSSISSKEAGGEMLIGDLVVYVGSSLIGFGSMGIIIGTLTHQAEVLFTTRVLTSFSMFGNSTHKYSCLVAVTDLVNISTLTGENRVQVIHQSAVNVSNSPSHRPKGSNNIHPNVNNQNNRNNNHNSTGHQQSSRVIPGRWNRSQWVSNEFIPNPPLLQMRPVIAVNTYGSGVYIPGLSPIPSAMQNHPLPYVSYPVTPRF